MKPEHSFIIDRALAEHCPELMGQAASSVRPGEVLPAYGRATERFTRILTEAFEPLLGEEASSFSCSGANLCDFAALLEDNNPLAAHCMMTVGAQSAPLLVSVDAAAILRIIDRTFGGKGVTPSPMPEDLPVSAMIMVKRIETLIAEQLGAAFVKPGMFHPQRHNGRLADLDPFPAATPLAVQTIEVAERNGDTWNITLAFPLATLADILDDVPPAETVRREPTRQAEPTDEPYCDLPMTLAGVIVDMKVTMATLTDLRPGMVLPVSVARNVPLCIGDRVIAYGTIGSVDDRVALQINKAF